MDLKAMIICGGGASSGFFAQNIRKAAKMRNIELDVFARGESELYDYAEEIDIVLIAPHLKYMLSDLQKECKELKLPNVLIDAITYSTLDGEKGLKLILDTLKEEK